MYYRKNVNLYILLPCKNWFIHGAIYCSHAVFLSVCVSRQDERAVQMFSFFDAKRNPIQNVNWWTRYRAHKMFAAFNGIVFEMGEKGRKGNERQREKEREWEQEFCKSEKKPVEWKKNSFHNKIDVYLITLWNCRFALLPQIHWCVYIHKEKAILLKIYIFFRCLA